ncbi:hypothetical protein NL533_33225, partial [Klebsiella pneumoniae]|nr:hypothetical protein [Klebsiella pneumoniae]
MATDGKIHTVAGIGSGPGPDGAAAVDTAFDGLSGLAIDSSGDLYTAEVNESRIRAIKPDGTILNLAGTGTAGFSGD